MNDSGSALKAYSAANSTRSESEREQEIMRHLPLVHTVVDRLCAHLPTHLDREDLFHAGVLGLISAVDRFDASRNNAFSTYAVLRIRGSVIDELRARDWVPRGIRSRSKDYHQAVQDLASELDRLPSDEELADALGIDLEDLANYERDAQLSRQVSLDAPAGEDGTLKQHLPEVGAVDDPSKRLNREERREILISCLEGMKEKERLVLKLYYFENLMMKEIAELLKVTESRVCQIHSRCMALLRSRLRFPRPGAVNGLPFCCFATAGCPTAER